MKRSHLKTGIVFCCLLMNLGVVSSAAPLFDTFASGTNYPSATLHWDAYPDRNLIIGVSIAWSFRIQSQLSRVTQITMDISRAEENSPNLQIAIFADDGGLPAATPIATAFPNPTLALYNQHTSVSYNFNQTPILEPGMTYWLVYAPAFADVYTESNNASYYFATSLLTPFGSAQYRAFGPAPSEWGDWNVLPNEPYPLFRLEGTIVPEPETWALFVLGSVFFWYGARRHRRRLRR
jgi:hypothetical protein